LLGWLLPKENYCYSKLSIATDLKDNCIKSNIQKQAGHEQILAQLAAVKITSAVYEGTTADYEQAAEGDEQAPVVQYRATSICFQLYLVK
jgi:hypothetical protein